MANRIEELLALGRIGLETGYYEQARGYFEKVLALDASNEEAWFQLAQLADEPEAALTCLDKVLSINPQNVEARKMADRLRRETDPDKLREMLQIAIEVSDKQAARKFGSRMLRVDPNDELTWIALGRLCDDLDEALSHFQQALAINPESWQAKAEVKRVLEQKENRYWASAKTAIEKGDKEQARKYLYKVLEINSKSEKAWFELGQLASEPEEALDYFERILTINPANEQARAAIRQITEEQEAERLRVRQELEQARAEQEAERLRAKQELEQARAEQELARLEHFILDVPDEPAEPSRKVVGGWTIPSVGRMARIGIVLVCGLLVVWFMTTRTMTYRQAIERAQQATVAVGIVGGTECRPLGSGAVVDPTGLIITNAHVVEEGRSLYCIASVEHPESETYWVYNARVIKRDTLMDLALLRIESHSDGSPVGDLSLVAIPLGDSDEVHIGDRIYACGYPGVGGLSVTVTEGLISGFEEDRTWIKTDAEISPGSSGGVAITEDGLLIGIPTRARIDPYSASKISRLIAVNKVRRFLESDQKNELMPEGWQVYKSLGGRFTVAYPSSWQIREEDVQKVNFSDSPGDRFLFVSFGRSMGEEFGEDDEGNVRIVVTLTAKQFSGSPGFKVADRGVWQGSVYKGYFYEFTNRYEGTPSRTRVTMVVAGDDVLLTAYVRNGSQYFAAEDYRILETVLETIKVK